MTKQTVTPKQVEVMARKACFYVDPAGQFLRMQFCEELDFTVINEDTGDEHKIAYDEVTFDGFEEFRELTKMEIPVDTQAS